MFLWLSLNVFGAETPNISGVYTVISTPNSSGVNCKKKTKPATYQWILTDSSGTLSINVQGKTVFSSLEGKILYADGNDIATRVSGYNKKKTALSWFTMYVDLDNNKISGTRTYINDKLSHCVYNVSGHKH